MGAGKADKSAVPRLDDFDNKGTLLKANRVEVPTFDIIPTLVQSQFDNMESRLKAHEISTTGSLDELRALAGGKADKSSVPTRDELQEVRVEVSQKAEMSDVLASLEQQISKKADQAGLTQISTRLDHKADLKWTQDSIRSLSDILLPVARAV